MATNTDIQPMGILGMPLHGMSVAQYRELLHSAAAGARWWQLPAVPLDVRAWAESVATDSAQAGASSAYPLLQLLLANPEFTLDALDSPEFAELSRSGRTVNIAEGTGLFTAAAYLHRGQAGRVRAAIGWLQCLFAQLLRPHSIFAAAHLGEKITAVTYNITFAEAAAAAGARLMLLGGQPGVAQAAAEKLQQQVAGLGPVATQHGYASEDELVAAVDAAQPQVLLVALGNPRQNLFIARHAHRWPQLRLAAGVGGWFDQLIGRQQLAPAWVRSLHLEWLWRSIRERRLQRAIGRAILLYSLRVWQQRVRGGSAAGE